MAIRDEKADTDRKISDAMTYIRTHLNKAETEILMEELVKTVVATDLTKQIIKKLKTIGEEDGKRF